MIARAYLSALTGAILAAGVSCATDDTAARIHRVETGLIPIPLVGEPALNLTLDEWLTALGVPGISIAVIDKGELAWAQGFGVRQAGAADPVTAETLFQAGSIAKPVTALTALRMVEQGDLTLDGDIGEALASWKIPSSPLTATEKVTLRRLLAHTAGITPRGFDGYEPGASVPTLVQILNGAPPANNPAAQLVALPGSKVDYSGLGYTIIQLAMVETSGKSFPHLMDETVFAPLGLKSSTFDQPLPDALADHAASGHDPSAMLVPGRWRIHPEMAAAGLWTTPSDLAAILIEVAQSSEGRSNRILSQSMTRQMLTQQMNEMSIGWVVRPDDPHGYFAHNGGTVGYRAHMRMYAGTGQGVVILTNGDNGADLFAAIANAVAAEYAWPDYKPRPLMSWIAVRLIAHARGVDRALAEYRHLQQTGPAENVNVQDLNGWGYMLLGQGRIEDAVSVFKDNVGYYPDNPYAFDSLGEALVDAGDKAAAERAYCRSLALEPANEVPKEALAALGSAGCDAAGAAPE